MATKTELALRALEAVLRPALEAAGAAFERNADRPDEMADGGAAVLRDGEQTGAEPLLSPLSWELEHTALLFVAAAGDDARDALLELASVAVRSDRTLGGAVRWAECGAPTRDLAELLGAEAPRTVLLPVEMHFSAPDRAG